LIFSGATQQEILSQCTVFGNTAPSGTCSPVTQGGPYLQGDSAFATSSGLGKAVCDISGKAIVLSFYNLVKNYCDNTDAGSFIDPAAACNQPIYEIIGTLTVSYSNLCYCSST
jgi:hypothetical protein